MAQAEQLLKQKNWGEALKAYRFALAEFPNNEAAVLGFGRACLFGGQAEVAKKAFEHALKVNPTNHEALNYMGDLYERLGQLDAAAEIYLRVGNIFAGRNNLETAIDSWLRATKLASGLVDAHISLADGLARLGQTQRAAREWLTLALIYQRRSDQTRALEQIQKAEKLLPDDLGVLAAKESLQNGSPIQPDRIGERPAYVPPPPDFEEENSFDTEAADDLFTEEAEPARTASGGLVEGARQNAMAELANAVFEDAANPGVMLIMQAIDLQGRGDLAGAADTSRRAVEAGLNRPALYFNLGLLYKDLGRFDEAIKMLQAAQNSEYDLSTLFVLGETYYAAHKFDQALKYFTEVVKTIDLQTVSGEKTSQLTQYYKELPAKYLAQNDANKINTFVTSLKRFFAYPDWEHRVYLARQRMENVSENGGMSLAEYLETPETEVIITAMALTSDYLRRNLVMTASEECLMAIQKAPFYLPLHVRLADILLKQEKTEQAITKYLYVAKVYEMRRQLDQVINIYQKILRLAPMDVTVRSKLIDLYISLHNAEQALEQYLVLADSYYQLAQVDRALEKYNEALRLAAAAANTDSYKVEILRRMGDIYNQRFDWMRATRAYEELLKIAPHNERVQRDLIDLYYKLNRADQALVSLDNLLALYQRQSPPQAVELLKDLASGRPDDMALRQRLAGAYVQNGLIRQAIAEYDALGEMQMEHGLRDQAIQTIQAILNLKPDDPAGYRRLLAQISGGTA